jgi:hypothetical protein
MEPHIDAPDSLFSSAKDALINEVYRFISHEKPEAIFLVYEGWMKLTPDPESPESKKIIQRMNKYGIRHEVEKDEGVIFYYETRDTIEMACANILTKNGKRSLAPLKFMPPEFVKPGRFSHFYKQAEAARLFFTGQTN